jgi:hypothetical protein
MIGAKAQVRLYDFCLLSSPVIYQQIPLDNYLFTPNILIKEYVKLICDNAHFGPVPYQRRVAGWAGSRVSTPR